MRPEREALWNWSIKYAKATGTGTNSSLPKESTILMNACALSFPETLRSVCMNASTILKDRHTCRVRNIIAREKVIRMGTAVRSATSIEIWRPFLGWESEHNWRTDTRTARNRPRCPRIVQWGRVSLRDILHSRWIFERNIPVRVICVVGNVGLALSRYYDIPFFDN